MSKTFYLTIYKQIFARESYLERGDAEGDEMK